MLLVKGMFQFVESSYAAVAYLCHCVLFACISTQNSVVLARAQVYMIQLVCWESSKVMSVLYTDACLMAEAISRGIKSKCTASQLC